MSEVEVKRHEFPQYKVCSGCGYTTKNRGGWSVHQKLCKGRAAEPDAEKDQLRERVQSLEQQLASKDEQLKVKDAQIEELLQAAREERKRPRTLNHNKNYNVNQQINVFGKESLSHITEAKLQALLADPETAVAGLVTLTYSVEENRNVKVPNVREKWVHVLKEDASGRQEWQAVPKNDILSEIVETNAMILEGEADDNSVPGLRYSRWHDKLRDSQEHNGKMFKEQMDYVHMRLAQTTRF